MLIPKLRFKEFNNPWQSEQFNNLFLFLQNNSFSRDMLINNEEGTVFDVHYGDILTKYNVILDFEKCIIPKINPRISLLKFDIQSYLKDGDILIADTAEDSTVGKACEIINIKTRRALSGLHTIPCRPKQKFANKFLGHYINSNAFHSKLLPLITGIKVSSISKSNISKLFICYPGLKEQEKIAKFLSLLYRKIELQQRKIEVLKMYKKGLIDNIFNKKHEDCVKLKQLIHEKSIRNKDMKCHNIYSVSNKDGFILQSEQFKDRLLASEDTSNYKIVKYNDFAYNPARINVGSIARMKEIEEGIISPMYICFYCNEKILPEYLEYYYDSKRFYNEMSKRLEGSVRMCLSYESMVNISIDVPTLQEQEMLSRVLTMFDEKINNEKLVLKELQMYKKGLLQKLFI